MAVNILGHFFYILYVPAKCIQNYIYLNGFHTQFCSLSDHQALFNDIFFHVKTLVIFHYLHILKYGCIVPYLTI